MKNLEQPPRRESFKPWGKRLVLTLSLLLSSLGITQMKEVSANNSVKIATDEEKATALKFYNVEREWLINTIESPTYKERLMKEGYSSEQADDVIVERLANIQATQVDVMPAVIPYVHKDTATGNVIGQHISPTDTSPSIIQVPPTGYDTKSNFGLMLHETTHAATDGNKDLSDYAWNQYQEDFFPLPVGSNVSDAQYNKNLNEYHGDPTELDARKKVLEYEMEVLGIKKYDEEFTEEHSNILRSRFNTLSTNSQEFINYIKIGSLVKIMNTIAENDSEKSEQDLSSFQV